MANGLYLAVVECRYLHAKYLLEGGLSINSKNCMGETALIGALRWIPDRRKRLHMFKWLLTMGADICATDTQTQKDAVTWAAFLNRTSEIKEMLRNYEVDVNLRLVDVHGRCALHYAVLHNNEHVTLWLSRRFHKYRMCVDVVDHYKLTPYLIATELGYTGCAHILSEIAGASPTQRQTTFFNAKQIWIGLDDWLDPRFCIAPSKPMDSSQLRNVDNIVSKSKVKFAALSLDNLSTSTRPTSGRTYRSDVTNSSTTSRSRRSRKTKRSKSKSGSSEMTSVSSARSLTSPSHSTTTQEASDAQQQDAASHSFLPAIDTAVSNHRKPHCALHPSASVKRKTLPWILELYAQQQCATYRPAAKKPVVISAPAPAAKKLGKAQPKMSIGVLGKVSKFAAMLKMKSRSTKQT